MPLRRRRQRGAEPRIAAQLPTNFDAGKIRKLLVEYHQIGGDGAGDGERLARGVGLNNAIPVGCQDAFHSPTGPLLVVRNQDERQLLVYNRRIVRHFHLALVGSRHCIFDALTQQLCDVARRSALAPIREATSPLKT